MVIKRLYFENMYSYEKAELKESDFNSGGVTVIIGRNLDQDTANAAGKSTILKVIYYMLFGLELNGESVESISNRKFNKGHFGEIEFEDRGNVFKIQRFRDYRPSSGELKKTLKENSKNTGIRFFINDMPFGDKKASGEAMSISETQRIIQNRIQISPELFLSSIMTAQDSKSNFLIAPDTKKKELLSDLLDLAVYEDAYQIVREEISSVEEQINVAERRVEEINSQIEEKAKELEKLKEKESIFSTDKEKEIISVKSKFLSLESEYKILKKEKTTSLNESEILASIEQKEAQFLEISKQNTLAFESEQSKILEEQITELVNILRLLDSEQTKLTAKQDLIKLNPEKDIEILQNEFDGLKQNSLLNKTKDELNDLLLSTRQETLEKEKALSALDVTILNLNQDISSLINSNECPTCERPWDENHLSHRQEKINNLEKELKKAKKQVASVEAFLADKPLELIEQAIKAKDIQNRLNEHNELLVEHNAILLLKAEINSKANNVKSLLVKKEQEKREVLESARKSTAENQELIEKLSQEIKELNEKLSKTRLALQAEALKESQLKSIKDRMGELAEQVQEIRDRANPYSEMIESTQEKISTLEERRKTNSERVKKLEEDLKYLSFWKNGFGPTGIRSFISDEVIVELNEIVQSYLNDLFDGAVAVVFESESTNQKGLVQNKISTKFYLNGKESPLGLLSGGERQRVVLAVDLALSDIAERRSGTKINLKFLDEPFNGIDSSGQMKALSLFSKIANHKSGFFIITHDASFQALCQNAIFIIKKDEISELVTKEKFRQIG